MLQRNFWAILAHAAFAYSAGITCASKTPVVVHPTPPGIGNSSSYTIEVRARGEDQHPLYTVQPWVTTVAEANTTTGRSIIHDTNVAYFDFCGPIDLTLTYNAPVQSAVVRPYSQNIVPQVSGRTIRFSLDSPKNVVVEVNNDIWDVLHLLTSAPDTDIPQPSDPDIIYFAPGTNNVVAGGNITGNELLVASGKTVYVAPGATVKVPLLFHNVSNAGVRGRGLVQGAYIEMTNSSNILVRDILLFNSNIGTHMSSDVTVRDLRSFSSGAWGDGMDFYCSRNVLVDNVFLRNSDDNIAIYQHRGADYGDSSNLTIQNAILWADYAHPLNMGTHGNTDNPETMDGVTFRNIDVLDHREHQMWYQGCLAINAGDSNLIQNVLVDGMRIENFREGQIVNLRVMYNTKYNTSPGRGIRNVYIKDMSYNGTHANPALLLGYDANHGITNVTFENLVVNGQVISNTMSKPSWYYTADMVPMFANEHVQNLTFITSQ